MRYRLIKEIPTSTGVFFMYGGTYRWLWVAQIARWLAELCPDLRDYYAVHIEPRAS